MKKQNKSLAYWLIIAIPVLLFHVFYGDSGFDWDRFTKRSRLDSN